MKKTKKKPAEFLDSPLFRKNTQWKVDYDYVEELRAKAKKGDVEAAEALAWLSKFSNEYYGSTFDKNDRKNLHKGKKAKREIYALRNAENRCLHTLKSNLGLLVTIDVVNKDSEKEEEEGRDDEN
jgi:hypothetical protein